MKTICMKREYEGGVEEMITRVTEALQKEGFGMLTRIDFHTKMQEKLGKDMPPIVILGACNPALAYEAYAKNSDVTSLLPCNVVVREVGTGKVSVELARPSALMECLGDAELAQLALGADEKLARALESL